MRRRAIRTTLRVLTTSAALGSGAMAAAQEQAPPRPPPEATTPVEAQPDSGAADSEGAASEQPAAELPEAIVLLTSGQKVRGLLSERNETHVVLIVGNIKMDLPMHQVDRIEVQPTVTEQYETMRRMIAPKDLPSRVLLVQWLLDKERYDWALKEIEGVLDEDPANPDAQRLRRLIVNQRDLLARAGQPKEAPREQPGRAPKFQFPLLTADQINLIKVYEVDLDNPPRLIVPREAIDRLIKDYADHELLPPTREGRDALYHQSPAEVLDLMFRMHARDLYGMVRVQDQPRSMERFRDDVQQSWLINSCATDRCHGGAEAGRLRLYNRRPNGDPTVYTDFLILDRFRTADDQPLINYEEPARSLLLQLALPRDVSLFPHPKVPGANGRGDLWKPALDSGGDKRFGQAVDWIKSMYRPRPDYPVVYEPPGPARPRADAVTPVAPR